MGLNTTSGLNHEQKMIYCSIVLLFRRQGAVLSCLWWSAWWRTLEKGRGYSRSQVSILVAAKPPQTKCNSYIPNKQFGMSNKSTNTLQMSTVVWFRPPGEKSQNIRVVIDTAISLDFHFNQINFAAFYLIRIVFICYLCNGYF